MAKAEKSRGKAKASRLGTEAAVLPVAGIAMPTAPPVGQPAVPEPVAPPVDRTRHLDHLKKINDVFYDQIRIADQKAAYIFTFMIAFLISSSDVRSAFRIARYTEGDVLHALFSAVLALAATVTMIAAVLVVLPRHRPSSSSLYWGGWLSHRDTFMTANTNGDQEYVFQEYLRNVDNLAALNAQKYRFVRIAFRGLFIAVLAYVLILVLAT